MGLSLAAAATLGTERWTQGMTLEMFGSEIEVLD